MRSLTLRFSSSQMQYCAAHPGLRAGQDPGNDGRPVIEITDIPEGTTTADVAEAMTLTVDCTWVGRGAGNGRHRFVFGELRPGVIIRD